MEIFKTKFDDLSSWGELRKIENTKIVKSMYIWLAIVPLSAKLFSKLEDTLNFTIAGNSYRLDLILPFSWKLFFFSALLFTLGNLIFLLFAPKIIKENKDYGEFKNCGRDEGHLEEYMTEEEKKEWHRYLLNQGANSIINGSQETKIDDKMTWFWKIHSKRDRALTVTRAVCFSTYLIGFLMFLKVSADNLWWVILQIVN